MGSGEQFGKYTLINKIADGGMAEVFLAVVKSLGGFEKRVALKKILPSFSRDDSFVHSFVNEARICGQLHHPNVVQVYGFDRIDDYLCLAMEFIEGLDLERIITHRLLERKLIPPSIAAEIVLQMLDGLDYAHTATSMDNEPLNIVHRDLKPSNILIDRSGVIKIVDFGVAKASTNLYKTMNVGTAKGTVSYMSPEQASGRLDLGPASDVFGVGAILYELLTLRRLFDGENLFMILDEVRSAPLEKYFARIPREVPEGLVQVLHKALERDLSRRYRSAAEMARDIRAKFPDLQGPELLARFVDELCESGMTIAGVSDAGNVVTDPAVGAAPETRPDLPLEDEASGAPDGLGSFDLARLGVSSVETETGVAPETRKATPIRGRAEGGHVRREDLATVPAELEPTPQPSQPPAAARKPSPASVLRSSTFAPPPVFLADDEPTPVNERRRQKAAPEQSPAPWTDNEPTPVTPRKAAGGGLPNDPRSATEGTLASPPESEPPALPPRPEIETSFSDLVTETELEATRPPWEAAGGSAPGDRSVVELSSQEGVAMGDAAQFGAADGESGSEQVFSPEAARDIENGIDASAAGAASETDSGPLEDWDNLKTEAISPPSDDSLHDAVSLLYSQPEIDVNASGGHVEQLAALPDPLPNMQVESLLDQPPGWSEADEQRPFGAPLERVEPATDVELEIKRQERLKQLRSVRIILSIVALVCLAAAVWTYLGMKPTVMDLLFPVHTRLTVVVENPPSEGKLILGRSNKITEVRRGVFHVPMLLGRKAAYEPKIMGPHAGSVEYDPVIIDPDDPSTWRIKLHRHHRK